MAIRKPQRGGRLSIARLAVRNVLGVEDHTIDLDTITVLEGQNASGKSSHLRALRSALGIDRTSLGRLARLGPEGQEEPTVEVLLVGDDQEVLVSRRGDGSPEVRERVGEDWRKVPRPVEWLRSVIDVEGANPALWLAADDETRARAVLEAMPLEGYDREQALDAAGLRGFRLPTIPDGLHPLEDLEAIEAAVFSARTEVNRQERAESDAAAKLLAGLPAEAPGDVGAEIVRLEQQLSADAAQITTEQTRLESSMRIAEERLKGQFKTAREKLRAAHEAKAAEIRAAAERRVAELLAETEAEIDALRTRAEAEIDAEDQAQQDAIHQLEERGSALHQGRERLAALREQQRSIETDRHVRATAAEATAKARGHEARSAELTQALDALKRYRLELAERLPIKGLAVSFDEKGRKSLTLDGVPLAQVNDGRLVELATEVSLLRATPAQRQGGPHLPLVLLDGIERLDPKARAALLREIASRGAQVLAAVVAPDALRTLRGEEALSA